jgi:hypothetical protein
VRAICVLMLLCSAFVSSSKAEPQQLNLMPMPASVQLTTGLLVIDPSFTVGISGPSDVRTQHAVQR